MEEWIEITKEEFKILKRKAVHRHVIKFCEPPICFYWDEEGIKNRDLSFGEHAYLKERMEYGHPTLPTEPAKYWKNQ